ncbi:hypothetical protein HNQ79_002148 [Streptomyces candidus]|uniref:Uncharacterized protein n=1 Tax=Streptomyces candidus TaxID=67283 RepID=A0A7X0LQ95_9ACTN|nr:hypothetical protein [Streptomyces candidus]
MPSRQQPRVTRTEVARYQSISCLIGTHHECTQSAQPAAPVGIPVVYESCSCTCHPLTTADSSDGTESPR